MADTSLTKAQPRKFGLGRVAPWLLGILCFGVLIFLLMQVIMQFVTPPPAKALQLVNSILLPDVFNNVNVNDPLAPGAGARFDHFDFQTLDPATHLLFMVHSGPTVARLQVVNPKLDVNTVGNIVVFNVLTNQLVKRIPIPHATGIIAVPDPVNPRVYAAGDDTIYVIDEHTFQFTQIKLTANDSPDAMEYDPFDHEVFISDPGRPANPDNPVIALKNQNVAVISTLTNRLVTEIPLANPADGKFGDDVGHVHYDPVSRRVFVVQAPLPDPNNPNAAFAPPSFLVAIDPTTVPGTATTAPRLPRIITRVRLSDSCVAPHGMNIDPQQQMAYIACVNSTNVTRVNLRTMQAINEQLPQIPIKPDIVMIDQSLHVLYVGCGGGLALFDISNGQLKRIGRPNDFAFGFSEHTILVNQQNHQIYLPIPVLGGRPTLWIMQYTPPK